MKVLKIKKINNKNLFKEIKGSLAKSQEFKKLVENYYQAKTLMEYLKIQKEMMRAQIISLMENKNEQSIDTGKYLIELYTQEQTRLNIEEMRKTIPKEQLEMFEIKITTKALKVIPKNEENTYKEIIKEYPKIFKNG